MVATNLALASIKATGAAATRTFGDRFAERLNVKDYGAIGDGAADDSAAINAAIDMAITAFGAGKPCVVYLPAGIYRYVTPHAVMTRPVSFVGDGPHRTYVSVDVSLSGDLFAWSDCWYASNYGSSSIVAFNNDRVGVVVEGLSVFGNLTSTNTQNAFVFYDHNDGVLMRDVEVYYLNGQALSMGKALNDSSSYVRESSFFNVRVWYCGKTSAAAVEITSTGTGDSSNQLQFYNLNIFAAPGQHLLIRNSNAAKGVTNLRFYGLRVEGLSPSIAGAAGDLFQIGDTSASFAGAVNNVEVYGFIGNASVSGYAAVGLYANSSTVMPYNIKIEGTITSGFGNGINVQAGRQLRFKFEDIAVPGTAFTVGASGLCAAWIELSLGGVEGSYSYSIDATMLANVLVPLTTSMFGGKGFSLNVPNSAVSGGNSRGANSVDLQLARTASSQVVSGSGSFATGQNNTVSGGGCAALGTTLSVTGTNSLVSGFRGADRGRYGSRVHSSGFITSAIGQAQITESVLRATAASTSAVRLTSDLATAGAANVVNLAANMAMAVDITVIAFDTTNKTNCYSWHCRGLIFRGATAGSTTLVLATPDILSSGTVTGAGVTATADTTNAGLNVTFTPPTSNTATWDIVARVDAAEVQ